MRDAHVIVALEEKLADAEQERLETEASGSVEVRTVAKRRIVPGAPHVAPTRVRRMGA